MKTPMRNGMPTFIAINPQEEEKDAVGFGGSGLKGAMSLMKAVGVIARRFGQNLLRCGIHSMPSLKNPWVILFDSVSIVTIP
jgi:hypothetical protein